MERGGTGHEPRGIVGVETGYSSAVIRQAAKIGHAAFLFKYFHYNLFSTLDAAVGMASLRLSLFALFAGAVILLLIFSNDVTYNYTRIHIQDGFSPRPPYPPFHPPPVDPPPSPPLHIGPENDTGTSHLWTSRAASIKEAFLHAYRGYEKYAPFPADELQPLSNRSVQKCVACAFSSAER
jgi:hypothetical protein